MPSLRQLREQRSQWLKKAAKAVANKYFRGNEWAELFEAAAEVLDLPVSTRAPEFIPSPKQLAHAKAMVQRNWSAVERYIRSRFLVDDREDVEKYLQQLREDTNGCREIDPAAGELGENHCGHSTTDHRSPVGVRAAPSEVGQS